MMNNIVCYALPFSSLAASSFLGVSVGSATGKPTSLDF